MTTTDDTRALVASTREEIELQQGNADDDILVRLANLCDAAEALEAERDTLRKTIDRCWKALGIATYEEADGKAIWELIEVAVKEIDGG